MLYKVKSIYNEQILSAENDEGEEQEKLPKKRFLLHGIIYISIYLCIYLIFLDSTKLNIVWTKITTFFKQRVSIIL